MNYIKLLFTIFLVFSFLIIVYAWLLLKKLNYSNYFTLSQQIFTSLFIGILIFVISSLILALLFEKRT
jgi:hypothetical protein